MIDIRDIKTRYEDIKRNIENRFMNIDIEIIREHYEKRSLLLREVEELREKRNINAEMMKKSPSPEQKETLIAEGKKVKEKLTAKEKDLEEIEALFKEEAKTIPNYADESAPIGKEDKDSLAIKFFKDPPKFDFTPKDHVTLGEDLDILDFEKAAKVSGQKFYYLKNKAVILSLALERFALDIVLSHGFTPFITPDIAREEILEGIGFNPRGKESNIYRIEETGTCLVGTAEITLGGYYAGEVLDKDFLPLKMVGLSHCFRREAGGAGQYSKGLYRVHQFSKLEMFIYSLPEDSKKYHSEMLAIEEEIFQKLDLAYRVVDTATGDLGAPAARKFDIEAWMPGRGEYGEVTSTSNCTDYQARSLNIRYKDDDGKAKFVHMLNGTAIAISRALVTIFESYQNKDGSITVPAELVKYTGFERIEK